MRYFVGRDGDPGAKALTASNAPADRDNLNAKTPRLE